MHKTVHIAHGLGLRRVATQPPGQQPQGLGLLVLRGQAAGRLRRLECVVHAAGYQQACRVACVQFGVARR